MVAGALRVDTMANLKPQSSRSSMSETVYDSEPVTPISSNGQQATTPQKEKKQKKKAAKQPGQQSEQKKQKPAPKVEKPFYQTLGEDLVKSTRFHLEPINQPLPKMPPMPIEAPLVPTPMSDKADYFSQSKYSLQDAMHRSKSATSLALPRKSTESGFSGITKIIRDEEDPSIKYRVKGAIYSLQDFMSMSTTEDLILRYGRVAHMGVRDHSYKFWMNSTRTAVVHFKVLNRVAVLGGDPLCHPDRIELTLKEFEFYCKKVGWKVAVIGGSTNVADLAKRKGWTCMNFGTEQVLNPQTNEVLLGKSGKRIVTQCKQLLDPIRGGVSIHTYTPAHGRDSALEASLRNVYDDWRNERNTSRDTQAFVTVFDLFAMNSLMTFLYTTDKEGQVNGFAALRKLGATDGYHIDPFIQTSSAPRGVSDLLIFASLAFLNAKGCSYLSLGYEPVTELSEIWGLPSIFHSTTKKVYKHVFGKIPVGGKEAFHARWKPDETQAASLYLVFVGKIPSPRYMIAMTHFANISLRQIIASDWQALVTKKEKKNNNSIGSTPASEAEQSDGEVLTKTKTPTQTQTKTKSETRRPKTANAAVKIPEITIKELPVVDIPPVPLVRTRTS